MFLSNHFNFHDIHSPFSHQKHNWSQLSSIFLAHQEMYHGRESFLFPLNIYFTFFYFLLFLSRANYFTLSWLVTPENLLQHLHSQILRRNMAQAINIVFMKIRSSFTFPKTSQTQNSDKYFDFPFSWQFVRVDILCLIRSRCSGQGPEIKTKQEKTREATSSDTRTHYQRWISGRGHPETGN